MAGFEQTIGKRMDQTKENKDIWNMGYYYTNGETNKSFTSFLNGYQYAKSLARIDDLPLDA